MTGQRRFCRRVCGGARGQRDHQEKPFGPTNAGAGDIDLFACQLGERDMSAARGQVFCQSIGVSLEEKPG